MDPTLSDFRTAAAVLLGFQLAAFSWRIAREVRMGDRDDTMWLPWCDRVLLVAILLTGSVLVPTPLPIEMIRSCFGAAVILVSTYPIGLAAHYEFLCSLPTVMTSRNGSEGVGRLVSLAQRSELD